jgi:hypothetical protein
VCRCPPWARRIFPNAGSIAGSERGASQKSNIAAPGYNPEIVGICVRRWSHPWRLTRLRAASARQAETAYQITPESKRAGQGRDFSLGSRLFFAAPFSRMALKQ